AFAAYDEEHCSTSEYIQELKAPSDHGDICDTHFEYHQAFLLPPYTKLPLNTDLDTEIAAFQRDYVFEVSLDFIKPPIA
ncbi:hypothetical protein JHD50_08465, partial [Sulfurimonas sp. MAG313]